ncbi:MAG: restriction endonuclease subunit S [Treponema sp.]|nr:restriction endonuclease subunit S [Treponema sp.]
MNLPDGWVVAPLESLLNYEQPTPYIVKSTNYNANFKTPVLTAGKSFIIGYTNETNGIYKDILPVIIFDDFTTATQFVTFPFKVKSSAMKMLQIVSPELNIKYLFYRMQLIRHNSTTHKRYWISDYSNNVIELPPLAEQHRIVTQIDALFSKLDKGVETLQTIQQQLRTYRQAVLKWAFDDTAVNTPTSPLYQICSHIVDCPHSTPKWVNSGKLCLRTTNFRKGYLDLSEKNYVSAVTFNERTQRLKPQKNDVLYSREGAILGLACLVPGNVELCMGQRMMLMRTNSMVLPKFLMHYLNSPNIEMIVKKKTGGTASPHINVGDVKLFEIPVPTINEQSDIITTIESRLSVCDKLEQIVDENLAKAAALRQSILKKAFEGKLVPQDPSDEPADKLLERIRQEKRSTNYANNTNKRRKQR